MLIERTEGLGAGQEVVVRDWKFIVGAEAEVDYLSSPRASTLRTAAPPR